MTVAAPVVAAALGFALIACGPAREPLPLDSPDEAHPAADARAAPTEPVSVAPLEEEALPDEPTGTGTAHSEPSDGDGVPVEPPAVTDTIDARTAPNVAAATRLAEAGRAQMAAGDDGAALEQLERAIAIDPSNTYAYYYLAELHFSNRTYDQAIAFADRAANLSAARAPEWASRAYTLQGNAFEAVGRVAESRDAYAHALQLAPGNLAAQVGLARVGGPAAAAVP